MKLVILAVIAVLVAVVAISANGPIGAGGTAEANGQRTFQVSGPVDLQVETGSGSVNVRRGNAGTVSVTAEIRVDDWRYSAERANDIVKDLQQNLPIRQQGNRIVIERVRQNGVSINYEIVTPAETRLNARSGSGELAVEGLRASVDLTTGSGHIKALDIQGDVSARTGSGGMDVTGLSGQLRAETGSGNIRVTDSDCKSLDARTGSGEINVERVVGPLEAQTGSGSIQVAGDPKGAWRLNAGSGGVRIHLPEQAAADIDAFTHSGNIRVRQPVTSTVQGNVDQTERKLVGKLGAGGPLVYIRTGSGSISID